MSLSNNLIAMVYIILSIVVVVAFFFIKGMSKNDVAEYKPKRPVVENQPRAEVKPQQAPKPEKKVAYKTINFAVKGTSYRSALEIQIAKNLKVGDMLLLKHEENNEHDAFALKVRTTTAAHIGYVEKKYSRMFYDLLADIEKCVVTKVTEDEIPYIYVDAYVKESAYYRRKFEVEGKYEAGKEVSVGNGVSFKVSTPRSVAMENCPDLATAEKLKYDHPEKAVDIFIRCAAEEDGLYSIHQACICYRRMKDYDSELKLIQEILMVCKEEGLDDSIATYESRLATVQKLIANREKKKEGK